VHPSSRTNEGTGGWVGLAILLLVGVLLVGYGFLQNSRVGLYAGVLVIVAGVLCGVVRIISRRGG
jgi:hypothetical protein